MSQYADYGGPQDAALLNVARLHSFGYAVVYTSLYPNAMDYSILSGGFGKVLRRGKALCGLEYSKSFYCYNRLLLFARDGFLLFAKILLLLSYIITTHILTITQYYEKTVFTTCPFGYGCCWLLQG